MEINEIRIHLVTLPFAWEFSHALKTGDSSGNVIVEVIARGGESLGFGEGAPRAYVTGESPESISESIKRFLGNGSFPWSLHEVSQIWGFVDRWPGQREHNAALCGLELAMLDALGRAESRSIMEYLPQEFMSESVSYGAVLPLARPERIKEMSRAVKNLGIHCVKVKMGRDLIENRDTLQTVCSVLNGKCRLKLDVNGAWDGETALRHLPLIADYPVEVVEQPMAPGDPGIADFSRRLKASGVKMMADESACSLQEVKALVAEGHYDMVNVRLSKCGGMRRSLQMIDFLRQEGVPYQVACQLGESGILSAAGRALSLLCSDALYHDGSYDAFLLKENVTTQNVSFGQGGVAGPLGGVGLGVEISRSKLRRLSHGRHPISFTRP